MKMIAGCLTRENGRPKEELNNFPGKMQAGSEDGKILMSDDMGKVEYYGYETNNL